MAYQFVLPESIAGFHDFFKLNVPLEEIAKALGYTHQRQALVLPRSDEEVSWEGGLRARLDATLPIVSFTSEMARREFLIAPILLEVAVHLKAKLRSEYPINISEQLRGNLDYLILTETQFLVVEAKNADTERGLAQLLAEMAALDKWTESKARHLYGAVSIGSLWQFSVLDRTTKTVTVDLNLYIIPRDLNDLLHILLGILRGKGEEV